MSELNFLIDACIFNTLPIGGLGGISPPQKRFVEKKYILNKAYATILTKDVSFIIST
jgi:hypothetical protein